MASRSKAPILPVTLRKPGAESDAITVYGFVDTGAERSVISRTLALNFLCLSPTSNTAVQTLTGAPFIVPVFEVDMEIRGKRLTNSFVSMDLGGPSNEQLLIGRDILETELGVEILSDAILENMKGLIRIAPLLKRKTVLILGPDMRFLDRMRTVKASVEALGYHGEIVREIEDIDEQSTEEKVVMMGSLSRFIICENSESSGHIIELGLASVNRFVTAVLQEKGKGATWMQADYRLDYSFMESFDYLDPADIPNVVTQAVKWAEATVKKRADYFNNLYPWRKPLR